MMRAFKHSGHYTNFGKVTKILSVAREYRRYYNVLMNKAIDGFYQSSSVPKYLPTLPISKLSERYRQTCGSQVRGTLTSWLSNIANRFADSVLSSSLSDEIKKKLLTISKLQLWFVKDVTLLGQSLSSEELKLCRRIFKQVRGRRPVMTKPSMLLDRKVATVEKALDDSSFDSWIKFSTLEKRKIIYLPVKRYDYCEDKSGEEKNCVQVIVDLNNASVDYRLRLFRSSS